VACVLTSVAGFGRSGCGDRAQRARLQGGLHVDPLDRGDSLACQFFVNRDGFLGRYKRVIANDVQVGQDHAVASLQTIFDHDK
jgi:hypothetical protein